MRKFKKWLVERFLPVYLKETLLKENAQLLEEKRKLEIHIKELNAYITGLENGIRAQRRIVINNGEVKK